MKKLKKALLLTLAFVMLQGFAGTTVVSAAGANVCPTCGDTGFRGDLASCPFCHAMVPIHYCINGHSWSNCGHI